MSLYLFISTNANPLSTIAATGITCATIIWQSKSATVEIKADMVKVKEDIAGRKKEHKADIDGVKRELSQVELRLTTDSQYSQGISVGSAYAMMKCLSGKRQMDSQLMGDIAKGARFDGEGCAPTKALGRLKRVEEVLV